MGLLNKGANVNAANRNKETAVILVATQYEADAVRLLLEKGADVNTETDSVDAGDRRAERVR